MLRRLNRVDFDLAGGLVNCFCNNTEFGLSS